MKYSDEYLDCLRGAYADAIQCGNSGIAEYLINIFEEIGVLQSKRTDSNSERTKKSLDNLQQSVTIKKSQNTDYGVPGMKWGVRKSELNEEDIGHILRYKSSESYKINSKLREGGYESLSSTNKEFVDGLDQALKKVPYYEGNLCRDILIEPGKDVDDFLAEHSIGEIIEYAAYTSFSKKPGYNPEANISIIVNGSTKSRDIDGIGVGESETLYERNAKFKVENVAKANGKLYILESEVNG